jgi:hypothetical protein
VLDKCANRGCSQAFLKLRDGKLFVIESEDAYPSYGGGRARQRQYYWLCKACCRTMTVIAEKGKGVQVVQLPAAPIFARAAS